MGTIWFSKGYNESLGDIYSKYGFLDWRELKVTHIIDNESVEFLIHTVGEKNLKYYEYDLIHDKSGFKTTVKPTNIICSLWFIGVFPENISETFQSNRYESTDFIYTFDKKTCKLKKKTIKK